MKSGYYHYYYYASFPPLLLAAQWIIIVLLSCGQSGEAGFVVGVNPKNDHKFYADNTRRTWAGAKRFCESLSPPMAIARIDNSEMDYTFLDGKWDRKFNGWYWTAAHTGSSISQFVWDGDSATPPSSSIIDDFGRIDGVGSSSSHNCVAFYSKPGAGKSHGIVRPCNARNGLTLCSSFAP